EQIMDETYKAIARLTRLKADFGQIPASLAEAQIERINRAVQIEVEIDKLLQSGREDEIEKLKPEIARVNNFSTVEHLQMQGKPRLVGLRYMSALWQIIKGN
ncbi:MAG: hypothetical protein PHU18_04715, partial [Dehalococcoidales bacterium]|nr:hypothetical protein [Dehalococcoidales bacterium]